MSAAIQLSRSELEFTGEQRQLIRDTYARGSSDGEFSVLMEIAKARRLNPLLKQIYFVKRWDSNLSRETWAVQISIDGLRAVAERTGRYDGQDEPEFTYGKDGKLQSCKVRVYRKDIPRPFVGVVFWDEFVQKTKQGQPTRFWAGMPHVMIAKCAEAHGIRKGFPEDTAGLYIPEEMDQAVNEAKVIQSSPVATVGSKAPPSGPINQQPDFQVGGLVHIEPVTGEVFEYEQESQEPLFPGVESERVYTQPAHDERMKAAEPIRVGFGQHKGKALGDLTDKQLSGFIKLATENLANPEKARWHEEQRTWIANLEAEILRRSNATKT